MAAVRSSGSFGKVVKKITSRCVPSFCQCTSLLTAYLDELRRVHWSPRDWGSFGSVPSCVVGNHFLRTSSQFICAIIEPANDASKPSTTLLSEITRAIASANRGLAPPLRISWARVLVLKGQQIPITKKGAIFHKKFSATNFHASLTVLGMNPRPTSNLLRILPRARLRIKLPTLFRKSLLRFWGSRQIFWKTTLSLPLQKLVLFFLRFFIYLLICYTSLEWIRLWLHRLTTLHRNWQRF